MRAFALTMGFLASAAMAEPSFDCGARLNATEQQICAASQLGQLDRTMAKSYFDLLGQLGTSEQTFLRSEQRAWLKWRNSCGQDIGCLERRYLDRIRDLYGVPLAGSTAVGPDQVATRRMRDGAFEIVYADGRIERMSPLDGAIETILPTGFDQAKLDAARGLVPLVIEPALPAGDDVSNANTGEINIAERVPLVAQPVQVQDDSFLVPADCDAWLASLDNQLWSAVEALLPDADRDGYTALVADRPCPTRLLGHVQAINFLARN